MKKLAVSVVFFQNQGLLVQEASDDFIGRGYSFRVVEGDSEKLLP